MNPAFLSYLADPVTRAPLTLDVTRAHGDDVIEGRLLSARAVYPIVGGVPRFAGASYVASFGAQWARWRRVQFDRENVGRPMEGHTRRMWEAITDHAARLDGALVGDFGCGTGRFLATVREKGGRAIGLELSDAADVAAENFRGDPDVLVCQADVLEPPLARDALDAAFSIGVLHHTPDPGRGVRAMATVVRPGGWTAVSVYPRGGYYDSARVRLFRAAFRALAPWLGRGPLVGYSCAVAWLWSGLRHRPRLARIVRRAFPLVGLPDRAWTALDTFDSLAPVYQSTHETQKCADGWRKAG
jgi:SAM-dependent methyltransferase/uncharacterized protein YbaR (Trm112 family)